MPVRPWLGLQIGILVATTLRRRLILQRSRVLLEIARDEGNVKRTRFDTKHGNGLTVTDMMAMEESFLGFANTLGVGALMIGLMVMLSSM